MNCIGTYDGTIFYNPANKFCIVSVKTADQSVPAEARSNRRYKDHLIRFTAVGYEIPRTDAVELELDGEWTKGKYGVQLQVEQWREIVPRTKNGVEGYLASGLIKGIGPKTAADIVERFGVDTLDILEHQPERLLEIRGITESKLEDIKASYAENRMLQGIMTLLAPFKITPKTALKIYQYFGPTSVEILEKSPFELCQISGFGFRRVDAIVQKSGGNLHDSMRIKGAVFCALDEGKSKRGHLYISSEELEKSALKLLNEKIPVPELRLHQQEVRDMMQEMILNGAVVSVKDNIYLPRVFAQEDETARRIAQRLVAQMPVEHIAPVLEQVKVEMGLRLSAQQEAAVYAAFRHGLSVITGSPGTGKTTVLRTILEVYRRLHPDGKIALMAPTGRASRRMSESTGFEDARTLHSGLGLTSEEDEGSRNRKSEPLSADLIIVDEFSMVDMWLAEKFFERMEDTAFARLTMHPKKNMIRCFQYINRKAWDYVQDELKASGTRPGPGQQTYGCDVPDDMCYQWAEDYFRDPDAKEDHEDEEKFVPKPYAGKSSAKSKPKKAAEKKKTEPKAAPKQEEKKPSQDGQMSLLDFGMAKAG